MTTTMNIDGYPLTPEQAEIIRAADQDVKVIALAGTGKTSTLRALAKYRFANERATYTAFNKAMATEAKQVFPETVTVKTFHALAYAEVGYLYRHRFGNLRAADIRNGANMPPLKWGAFNHQAMTQLVRMILKAWMQSRALEIGEQHVPWGFIAKVTRPHVHQMARELKDFSLMDAAHKLNENGERHIQTVARQAGEAALEFAVRLWAELIAPNSTLAFPMDAYLKLYAMNRPRIRCDALLVDEAQDLNPVMLQVVEEQSSRRYLVGDPNQQIYAWRGAVDALAHFDGAIELPLTTSFRFGADIADTANEVLERLGSPYLLEGLGPPRRPFDPEQHYAQVFRTNAAMLAAVAGHVSKAKRVNCPAKVSEMVRILSELFAMSRGNFSDIRDPKLQCFETWPAVVEELADDGEYAAMIKMVERDPVQVASIIRILANFRSVPIERAQVTMTTAHQAKGRQWDQVEIAGDFAAKVEKGEPEELRLLYVAITRARYALHLPEEIRDAMEERQAA